MKLHALDHRSAAWFATRRGMPTASQFHRIITQAGRPSSQADLYRSELIAEKIFQCPMGRDVSGFPAVTHGIRTEPEACQMLEDMLGERLQPGGFMTDDEGRYGASPDRLIIKGNRRELVEVKCPYEIPRHVCNLLYGPGDDHKAQIQGQLLISGFDRAHFFSYHPACPPRHMTIERDEKFIVHLAKELDAFCRQLQEDYLRARELGEWRTS